jgi:hypothetical protein
MLFTDDLVTIDNGQARHNLRWASAKSKLPFALEIIYSFTSKNANRIHCVGSNLTSALVVNGLIDQKS